MTSSDFFLTSSLRTPKIFIEKFSLNTIIAMHVSPYSDEFNNNVAKYFEDDIMHLKQPLCCIYGHGHSTRADDIFGDGMMYYQITCAKKRQYYVFTVNEDGYDYETISY